MIGGEGLRTLLLDVEGTTTPVEFVSERLFPYARERARSFVERHGQEPDFRADIERLREERALDQREGHDPPAWNDEPPEALVESVVAYVHFLMDRDRKSTGLKALQGRIWKEGYEKGALQGEVFPDVPPAFARWRRQGREIAIFSSGSIPAQRLLFRTISSGDLTTHIRAYFDTTTGPKREPASYTRIAGALEREPSEILFLSDVAAELEAARVTGMRTSLCVRGGEAIAAAGHPLVMSLDTVCP